ncbi:MULTISPECIES: xanthine phosphoribosyltransferase [Clostridium]|uniref:Xanthine phosphoribosyltransferase n=2 Tax=Clostridium TaxID=1485 RepID=A0A084JCV0_9CLOT|nr:xanthine phosphoribosyltransferase [Clostridium sulfidigenes]KEZ86784.1 xanthine phosphoribosyltransferase [Clostridium sulfidigenes]MBE6061325.1 xanthine phosphoribosyltransferase [Clostridium sulfidigenes]HAR85781.1 xanthine phosphoribosyltransferase [Clostridium sp.]
METLKNRILKDGHALNESVLKVDSFLNHGVDAKLMQEIGTTFKEHFENHGITKIFTIESSGIAPTVMTALQMELPMVTLKKQTSKILSGDVYQTTVHSFTKAVDYELTLSKKFISPEDNILIIDDFLAYGEAAQGAIRLVEEAGAKVAGIGIVIEKSFQPGRKNLEDKGYEVYSLARVSKLGKDIIEFVEE